MDVIERKPEIAFVDDQGRVMVADDPNEPNLVREYVPKDEAEPLEDRIRRLTAEGDELTAKYLDLRQQHRVAVAERDALLAAVNGIAGAASRHGVNDQVGEALAYADKIVARRIRDGRAP